MVRRGIKALLALAVLVGLVLMYRSDRALFRYPDGKVERAHQRITRHLQARDVALLYTADEQPGWDWVSRVPVELNGTRSRTGRFGRAISFDGGRRTTAVLPLRWKDLPASFTLALWVKLDAASLDQEILFTHKPAPLGFKLDHGHLSFFISNGKTLRAASYVFTNLNRYVHLAAVVDAEAGETRLYEDGQLRATCPTAGREITAGRLALGRADWDLVAEPLMGEVDEIVAWRRALAGPEIEALARSSQPALVTLVAPAWRKYRWARTWQAGVRRAVKLVDLFNPAYHPTQARRSGLPEINLMLSKPDERFFARAHRRSTKDGHLSAQTAEARMIDVVEAAQGFRARLSLTGGPLGYPDSPRRSWILEPEAGRTVLGLTSLRLVPPESAGWLGPLLETAAGRALHLPVVSNGLCQLVINGERKGIYYYEDYRQLGMPAGVGARQFEGVALPSTWRRIGISEPPPLTRDEWVGLRNELYERYRPWLVRDARSPLSGREIMFNLRADKGRLERWPLREELARQSPAQRTAAILTPFFVLGSNPAPYFLLHDLDLKTHLPPEVEVTWTSSDPEVLDHQGRVRPPLEGGPRGVTLTAQLRDGQGEARVELPFRVMPRERPLPTLFLWANQVLERISRVDAVVMYLDGGSGADPRRWLCAQEERAGISMRGHTTRMLPKKPLGIRFPEPHGLLGTTNVLKLNLVNPARDPAYMRNRLSYDLFRNFGGPGQPRLAPTNLWTEVFVNGKYFGLFEAMPAIRSEWLGLDPYQDGDVDPALVYKAQSTPVSLVNRDMMRQTEPSRRHGHFPDPAVELALFIEKATRDEFVSGIGQKLDLDNVMDFHLLLDVTENYNGWPFKFPIHDILVRPAGSTNRFFLVPYDFDTTWDPAPIGFYHSYVFQRLLTEYPGYPDQLARRWRELRQGPLDLARLEAQVDAYRELLTDYEYWDNQRWQRYPDMTYEKRVQRLLSMMRHRIEQLDVRFGGPTANP